jgi:hypothetical protein
MKAIEVMIKCKFNLAQDGEGLKVKAKGYIFVTRQKGDLCALHDRDV